MPEKTTWKTFERCVMIKDDVVIKRELGEDELIVRQDGTICRPFWAKERLQNEAATIQFVARNTTIPVPSCRLYIENGLVHLETTRIRNGVLLMDVDDAARPTAIAAVGKQLESDVIPQLQSLRRNSIGSVDLSLPVFPPQRVYNRDRRSWERVTSDNDSFVLCHNDLGPQNIFVCPSTFRIVAIIDWEFAGYFPSYFELPLWTTMGWRDYQKIYEDAEVRELALFGLKLGDLQDCLR